MTKRTANIITAEFSTEIMVMVMKSNASCTKRDVFLMKSKSKDFLTLGREPALFKRQNALPSPLHSVLAALDACPTCPTHTWPIVFLRKGICSF